MKIIYFSLTGNCRRFLFFCKLDEEDVISMTDVDIVDYDYILVTPTVGFGEVPKEVTNFLNKNGKYLRGVVSSGNRNWGANFAIAGDIISKEYNVPLLMKIELLGNKSDIEKFKKIYEEIKINDKI